MTPHCVINKTPSDYFIGCIEDSILLISNADVSVEVNSKFPKFDTISCVFILIAMIFVAIPALMIFLSIVLLAKVNRCTNIIVATVFIPYMLFNLAGLAWIYMYFASAVEVALLCLIIRHAWKWPRIEA